MLEKTCTKVHDVYHDREDSVHVFSWFLISGGHVSDTALSQLIPQISNTSAFA